MSASVFALKEKSKFKNLFHLFSYNRNFSKKNPGYFHPDGLLMFCGAQGSGKTLSAVNYIYRLLKIYPKCILVTNVELTDFPIDDKRVFLFSQASDLTRFKNDLHGVIFFIDEIQLYFNSLGSKNIDIDVMKQISQQRKQRIHIVATSQVFGRMSKALREQFDTIIYCQSKCFGLKQKNSLIDRDSIDSQESTGTNIKGTVKKVFTYYKSPSFFNRYDTYSVIDNKNLKIETERNDFYDTSN